MGAVDLKEWDSTKTKIPFRRWVRCRVRKKCAICGKEFWVRKARIKEHKYPDFYCSKKCTYIGYCKRATERRIIISTLNSRHAISWRKFPLYVQELHEILGDQCAICGYKGRLELHHFYYVENGVTSKDRCRLRRTIEALEHPERFVYLCSVCHSAVTLVENHNLEILDKIRDIVMRGKVIPLTEKEKVLPKRGI